MADIRTFYRDIGGDWQLDGPAFAEDDGLETAVIISLFTDKIAPDGSEPPGGDKRGWWGDAYADIRGDRIGSHLWLLGREKQLQSVVTRAREYAEEALVWLIEDGIASRVTVTAEISGPGRLGLLIEIERPQKPRVEYRFNSFWNRS